MVIRCAGATHTEAMVNITMSTTMGLMATRMRQNIPHLDIQNILHLDIQNIHHKQIMSSKEPLLQFSLPCEIYILYTIYRLISETQFL